MTEAYVDKRLADMRRLMLLMIGADSIFLAWTLSELPIIMGAPDPSQLWRVVGAVLALITAIPAGRLIIPSDMREIALERRLGVTIGSLTLEWIVFTTIILRLPAYWEKYFTLAGAFGIGVVAWYGYARWRARRDADEPERIFP